MKKIKIQPRKVVKFVVTCGTAACVDAMVCGVMVAAVPVGMMNPILGAGIVAGGALVANGLHENLVAEQVEDVIDTLADIGVILKKIRKGETVAEEPENEPVIDLSEEERKIEESFERYKSMVKQLLEENPDMDLDDILERYDLIEEVSEED